MRATGERVIPAAARSFGDRLMLARHEFAYRLAAERLPARATVLDLGCGTGYGTVQLAARARRAVGVDPSREAIAYARRTHSRDGIEFHQLDGDRLPFADGGFDAVVSCQVIEHVEDDAGFVEEACRVLRPGGALLLTTPNRALRLAPGARPWSRFHVREYSAAELAALLVPRFPVVRILGVRATPEIERFEAERVAQARRLARVDPLDLRRFVPGFLRDWALRRSPPGGGEPTPADFRLDPDAERGLDLFAIAASE